VVVEGVLISGAFPFMGLWLVEQAGSAAADAPRQAGLILGAFGLGGLLYAIAVRRIVGWLGVRRMCLVGSASVAAAHLVLAVAPLWWLGALAMMAAGLSFYMLHNSLQTEATELAPSARGSAVALFACGLFAGQGLGPVLFGALARGFGFGTALCVTAVGLVLLGQVVVRRIIAPPVG
jgi:predicted MFS family arabinose efflux permease